MQYRIHGKPVIFDGECGLYKIGPAGISITYADMLPDAFVSEINSMPKDKAIEAVTGLRNLAAEQANWQQTPQNLGFPIIQQKSEPTPIDEVRDNLRNTERFCNDVLKALQGE